MASGAGLAGIRFPQRHRDNPAGLRRLREPGRRPGGNAAQRTESGPSSKYWVRDVRNPASPRGAARKERCSMDEVELLRNWGGPGQDPSEASITVARAAPQRSIEALGKGRPVFLRRAYRQANGGIRKL